MYAFVNRCIQNTQVCIYTEEDVYKFTGFLSAYSRWSASSMGKFLSRARGSGGVIGGR